MMSLSHLHPMLVHFPIALVAFGFLAELASLIIKKELCFSKISLFLLLFGTLSAVAAWLSGSFFTSEMGGAAGVVKDTHELFATITMALLLITSLVRIIIVYSKTPKKTLKWLSFILYGLASVCVVATGYFGGTLVYNYMMPL